MVVLKCQSLLVAGLWSDGARRDVGHVGLSPQRGCAEVLWLEEGPHHSLMLPSQEEHPQGA